MWPLIMGAVRTYAVYLVWPVAAVVGVIGYNVEWTVKKNDLNTPWKKKSIMEEREDRKLEEAKQDENNEFVSLKERKNIPKTILTRYD